MSLRSLIVILGPTASGKSALGVHLGKKFHGVVVSADSRQVYRGMNIGTGKITHREMNGVPHYLLDVASPRGQYSVDRYVRDVTRVLKKIPAQTPIFLVGGSPFYIDALTKPGSYSPVPPNPELRQRLEKLSTTLLRIILNKKNADRVQTVDPANRRRLIRAIEIASYRGPGLEARPQVDFRTIKVGLTHPTSELHKKIDQRVDQRLRQGMINEVRRLRRQGLAWKKLDGFGLEYRFLARYLRGQLTKTEAVSQLKSVTHDFAKRQMTWWKRDTEIHWTTPVQAERLIRKFLGKQT